MAEQILLNISTNLIKIGSIEKAEIHIINMLGHLHYADAPLSYTS